MHRKKKIIIAAAATLVIGAGSAFAYWTTTGNGNGSGATSAGASDLTITQTSTIANMFPGDSPQTIGGTVKNNATNSAYVNDVTVSIASVTATGTCSASDYTLTTPVMHIGQELAAGATVSFSGAKIQFNNKTDANQDGCKGATVNLSYASN